jgi:hypothetical protein
MDMFYSHGMNSQRKRLGPTRRSCIVLCLALFAATLSAQMRTGTIYGKITGAEGNALPGVTVTLRSPQIAPLTTITSKTGAYRFVSISPGPPYRITAELPGFKTATRTGVIVRIGSNSEVNLRMDVGTFEEQITVVARTPIVDTKTMTVGTNIDKEALQSLPTARDPWAVLQLAPAIMVDRENVGGSESGQQSGFISRGDTSMGRISGNPGANNIWAIDGIDITDSAELGLSALYFDFDMFEELQIQTGGAADVSIQTAGTALNMVTRRGGNRMSLGGRFYLTDNFFQADNLTDDLRARGVTNVAKIQQIKDFGFNVGGPILKDKLWWWGAYGVQDIFAYTITGNKDQALHNNYSLKLNGQLLANNRFEALLISGAEERFGWNSSFEKPEGDHLQGKYHWGNPIMKLQDEHVFGNNFHVSLKLSFNDAGSGSRPMTDPEAEYPIVYSQTQGKYVPYETGLRASWGSSGVSRPRRNYQIQGTYFKDTFLGASHEVKFGVEYTDKAQRTEPDKTGNTQGFDITREYNSLALDADADGTRTMAEMAGWQRLDMYRRSAGNSFVKGWAAYIQDTIVKGNFTLSFGLRFDKQWPGSGDYTRDAILPGTKAWDTVFTEKASETLDPILPDVPVQPFKGYAQVVNGEDRHYQWNTFSPRLGLTWDVRGDGKTVAKLSLSQYGDIMGVGLYVPTPYGTGGGMRYWWNDMNADRKVQRDEMYWSYSDRYPAADPANPGLPYRYVPYQVFNSNGTLTDEAYAMLQDRPSFYDSDPYYAGMIYGFSWYSIIDIDGWGAPIYFLNRAAQSSSRTLEVLLTVEREILPGFLASINFTYRKFDRDEIVLTYYPAEHADEYPEMWEEGETPADIIVDPETVRANGWYVQAGTIPGTYYAGGIFTQDPVTGDWSWAIDPAYAEGDPRRGAQYSSGDAAGRPYYLPGPGWPTTSTRYSLVRTSDNSFNYYGVDLVLNKRLSHKWMMNASFTWQAQRTHWGTDFFDPTNRWCNDGKPYGDWGDGSSGKVGVLMYTRWMAKISGLYQLPWGFNISGTLNAREGWKIPNYFTLDLYEAPNYAAGHAVTISKQNNTADSLPAFCNITLRLEKRINIGQGRFYLMADAFNLLNSNMPIRSYSKNDGTAYYRAYNGVSQQYDSSPNTYRGVLNEILNPRIWRFGVRFEF